MQLCVWRVWLDRRLRWHHCGLCISWNSYLSLPPCIQCIGSVFGPMCTLQAQHLFANCFWYGKVLKVSAGFNGIIRYFIHKLMVLVPKTHKIHVFFKGDVLFWKKKAPARNATHSRLSFSQKRFFPKPILVNHRLFLLFV